jgi:mannose-6-phosphate isomerase
MARADYPLLLTPHLAPRVWGGDRLGKGIGEAWDLSVHPNGPSVVRNGRLAGTSLADAVRADESAFGGPIGLLAKRLDCRETLSVQVHPKGADAKTEAWVPLAIGKGAGVYHGFRRAATREEVRRSALDGTLDALLRFVPVPEGRAIFVPSGTVHAIGAGLFLFELQQSSDTTYRLYDWGRPRELHVEEALACADLDARDPVPEPVPVAPGRSRLVGCDHFFIDRLEPGRIGRLDPGDAWIALLPLSGRVRAGGTEAGAGETLLIPRAAGPLPLENSGPALLYGPTRWNA